MAPFSISTLFDFDFDFEFFQARPKEQPSTVHRIIRSSEGEEKVQVGEYEVTSDILGTGGNSVVYRGFHLSSGLPVAIKCIPISAGQGSRGKSGEVEILQRLLHPGICRLRDHYVTDTFLYLVLDVVEGEELFEKVRASKGLPEEQARDLFMRLLSPVLYLHTLGIAHRDLKLENVLVNQEDHVALIDFGHASLSPGRSAAGVATLEYSAPEIILYAHAGLQADVWALGVLLFAMLYGSFPFDGPPAHVRALIAEAHVVFPSTREVSAAGRDLILRMLQSDPSQRPRLREIKDHPWFMLHLPSYYPSPSFPSSSSPSLTRESP